MHCIGASVRRRKPVQVASSSDSTYFGFVLLIIHTNYLPETFINLSLIIHTNYSIIRHRWKRCLILFKYRAPKIKRSYMRSVNSSFTRVNTNDPIFRHVFFDYLTSGKTVAWWLTCKNHEHEPREIQTISLESNFRDFWNSSSASVPLRLLS